MEKIYNIIKPSVDGLNNEFDNDHIEKENFHCEINEDTDCNSNLVLIEDLFDGTQHSSEAEDSVVKYISTMEGASDTFSISTMDIHTKKFHNMDVNVYNKDIPKGNMKNSKDHHTENNISRLSECTLTPSAKEQDITNSQTVLNSELSSEKNEFIDCSDSLTIQKHMANSNTKMKERKTLVLNMLKKKISKSHKENIQLGNEYVQKFQEKRIDSISQKVLQNSVLTESKTELVNLMKMGLEKRHEIEINILNMQLQREKLQMQLIKKKLEIKNCLLKQLQSNETLDTAQYL